jgi:deoxycytidine triphosphate deaminase
MLISNHVIEDLMKEGKIKISDFDPQRLGLIEYHILPYSLHFFRQDEEGLNIEGNYILSADQPYSMRSKEYINITIKERFELSGGIFVQFYPASALFEHGIMLNCGRLRPGYKKSVSLGLYNASGFEYLLRVDTEIARAVFFQLPPDMPMDSRKSNINPEYNEVLEQLRLTDDEIEKLETRLLEQRVHKKSLEGKRDAIM